MTGFTGNGAQNYKLPQDGLESEYEIRAKKLTVSMQTADYVYNRTARNGISVVFSGFPNSAEANAFEESDFAADGNFSDCAKASHDSVNATFVFSAVS